MQPNNVQCTLYTYVRIYNVHKCIQQTKVNSIAENKNFIAVDFYDFPTNFRNKSADMFQKYQLKIVGCNMLLKQTATTHPLILLTKAS